MWTGIVRYVDANSPLCGREYSVMWTQIVRYVDGNSLLCGRE